MASRRERNAQKTDEPTEFDPAALEAIGIPTASTPQEGPTLQDVMDAVRAVIREQDQISERLTALEGQVRQANLQQLALGVKAAHNRLDGQKETLDRLAPQLAEAVKALKAPAPTQRRANPPDPPAQEDNQPPPRKEQRAKPASSDPRDMFR